MRYLAILFLCASALAQQHKISVQKYEAPKYPAIARQAHISGDVKLALEIAADGTITSVKVLSGHPMLIQSAKDAIVKWRFHCDDCAYGATFTHEFVFGYRFEGDKPEQRMQFPGKMVFYVSVPVIETSSGANGLR